MFGWINLFFKKDKPDVPRYILVHSDSKYLHLGGAEESKGDIPIGEKHPFISLEDIYFEIRKSTVDGIWDFRLKREYNNIIENVKRICDFMPDYDYTFVQ